MKLTNYNINYSNLNKTEDTSLTVSTKGNAILAFFDDINEVSMKLNLINAKYSAINPDTLNSMIAYGSDITVSVAEAATNPYNYDVLIGGLTIPVHNYEFYRVN